jgi:D-alanyl-lipoteichoic acid acyltransferase DltB (MBOAT superfamily)
MQPDHLPDFMPSPSAMLFNSIEYLLAFLPITVLGYFWLNRRVGAQAGKGWLVIASLFFYGWWSIAYLWLIGGSILFNYSAAWLLGRSTHTTKKWLLRIAIASNVALLGYFKYTDFFISSINPFLAQQLPLLHIALPLGISFFTFTQIAFLVDVQRGLTREYHFVHYCLFVTYFPHLIAGPIMHHKEMMPQFSSKSAQTIRWDNIQLGLLILAIGLLKKVCLADSVATAANTGFSDAGHLLFHQAWLTSLSYTMQLYFDFSGYTDMAIGASLLFNIHLPENFNSPYKSTNIRDFWQRWHITLSRWLRDYLYIPLGGSRRGEIRTHIALLITFLLGGLWHGASWTFVIWGALHGSATVLHRLWRRLNFRIYAPLAWLLTFLFVNAAWVFFRASDFTIATQVLSGMAGLHGFPTAADSWELVGGVLHSETWSLFYAVADAPTRQWLMLFLCLIIALCYQNTAAIATTPFAKSTKTSVSMVHGIIIGSTIFYTAFMTSGIATFIYFYF